MLKAIEVRSKLRDVIVGALSVREFDKWIWDASWNSHRLAEPSARNIMRSAQMRLLEYYNSDANPRQEKLRADLAVILNNIVVSQSVGVTVDTQREFTWLARVRFDLAETIALLDVQRNPGQDFAVPSYVEPKQSKILYA